MRSNYLEINLKDRAYSLRSETQDELSTNFDGNKINVLLIVKNEGVIFNSVLNMDHQLRNIVHLCYNQLRIIGRIRP